MIWEASEATPVGKDEDDYLDWYVTHCQPFVMLTSYQSIPLIHCVPHPTDIL